MWIEKELEPIRATGRTELSMDEAKSLLKALNKRIGRDYDEAKCTAFLDQLVTNKQTMRIDINVLKTALLACK